MALTTRSLNWPRGSKVGCRMALMSTGFRSSVSITDQPYCINLLKQFFIGNSFFFPFYLFFIFITLL
jgi:hypothetical protein